MVRTKKSVQVVSVTPCHTMPPGYDWLGCLRWLNRESIRHVRSWCSCDVSYEFSKPLFFPTHFYDCGDLEFTERLSPELEAEIAAEIEEPAVLAPEPSVAVPGGRTPLLHIEALGGLPVETPDPEGTETEPEDSPRMYGPARICPEPGIIVEYSLQPGVPSRKRRNPEPILGGPAYAAKLRRMK